MANGAHSILPPSGAGAWVRCALWVIMQQMYPETEETAQSREGTAAHEVAQSMIQRATVAHGDHMRVGDVTSNGEIVDFDMYEGAKLYADHVAAEMRSRGIFGGSSLGIEQSIEIKRVHDVCHGTPDLFIWDCKTGELIVYDFKYGYEVVEAFENWQAITYVAGLFDRFRFDGISDQLVTIKIRIVQPRAYHRRGTIREWSIKLADLRPYFNQLEAAAAAALGANPTANSGPYCKHCNGLHDCEAAIRSGVSLYEAASGPVPLNMSPAAIGAQLAIIRRALEQLKALETAYSETVAGMMRNGQGVPGWSHEPTYGRRKWNKPIDEVIALGDLLGHDLRKEEVITPKQAEQLGIDSATIKAYCQTSSTGFKLVPDNGNYAKEVFSK